MLCKMVLPFESVNEILKCDHSNESYRVALRCGSGYFAVQGSSNVLKLWLKPRTKFAIQMKPVSIAFVR